MDPADGFEEFFTLHYGRVVRALTLALGSREAAEDAAQEGFARALRRWPAVSGMERPEAWVYVVSVRVQRRRFDRDGRVAVHDSRAAADGVEDVADRRWAHEMLLALPTRQRLALVLRYFADLPLAEVAEAMGCSTGTVKATIHQSLTKLRMQEETESNAR